MENNYDRDSIRELLIQSVHSKQEAKDFFSSNYYNINLLKLLLEIALDDYSDDARMEASYIISQFPKELLSSYENELLILQEDEWDSVSVHAYIALAKIKSRKALRSLIEKRIAPEMSWVAKALLIHLEDQI